MSQETLTLSGKTDICFQISSKNLTEDIFYLIKVQANPNKEKFQTKEVFFDLSRILQ